MYARATNGIRKRRGGAGGRSALKGCLHLPLSCTLFATAVLQVAACAQSRRWTRTRRPGLHHDNVALWWVRDRTDRVSELFQRLALLLRVVVTIVDTLDTGDRMTKHA